MLFDKYLWPLYFIVGWIKRIHIHKWKYEKAEYDLRTIHFIETEIKPAIRTCSFCHKTQFLDVHCLGLNPPKYTKRWLNLPSKIEK